MKVERMKQRKDGHLIPADSYILTVEPQTTPKEIKVGFLNKHILQQNPPKCANYGKKNHENKDCEKDPHCANCNGNHPAYFRSCPNWKFEKKILHIKYEGNIPFCEARKGVEPPVCDPSNDSYASVSKPHPRSNTIKHPSDFITMTS